MVKKKLSLDLTNIFKSKKKEDKKEKKNNQSNNFDDYQEKAKDIQYLALTIPSGISHILFNANLYDCTAEEFASWLVSVHPIQLTQSEINSFDDVNIRIETFNLVLAFYARFYITLNNNPKLQMEA